jgi:serine/threonine-protein kinase
MAQPAVKKPSAPKIGDYEIISKIGKGGIAEVYKALQTSLQREVAIKILSSEYNSDSEIVKRFERESILIARLNHPNIVHVIDKGTQGRRYYFVMEYVDGTDFRTILNNPNIDLTVKIEIIVQTCKALDFAHKNDVVHRDIKPANILIDRQGNAKVADFGIAQLRDSADLEMTSSDLIMGTLAYMSPEQKFSSANVTRTADIYSLGIILYEIICGRKPEGVFKPPSLVNPKIPKAMDAIVSRCLAENPSDRYPTAGELKNAILNAFSGEIYDSGKADSAIARVESFMGRCRFLDTIKEDRYGATYMVENKETHKLYIIKKSNQGEVGLKEAKVLSSLKHKNIIGILGAGGDVRKSVIVTDYARNGSLAERLIRNYSWEEGMEIVVPIAEGLAFAHKNNIVHGNLRPSNILFDKNDTIKLTDFGLPPHYTKQKDWYAAPEKKQSKLGDTFSLGVIFHMLLTNKIPQHDRSGNPYLNELELKVPKPIRDMLSKMLQIRVARRYQSFEEMLIEYSEYLESLEETPVKVAVVPTKSEPKKSRLLYYMIAAAIILGILLALDWGSLFN